MDLHVAHLSRKREHQLAFGDDRVVHHAAALRLGDAVAARLGQLGVNEERVAGKNRFAKFYVVRAHEITDPAGALASAHHQHARHLRHRFHLQHAGHDRMAGEMALENTAR